MLSSFCDERIFLDRNHAWLRAPEATTQIICSDFNATCHREIICHDDDGRGQGEAGLSSQTVASLDGGGCEDAVPAEAGVPVSEGLAAVAGLQADGVEGAEAGGCSQGHGAAEHLGAVDNLRAGK